LFSRMMMLLTLTLAATAAALAPCTTLPQRPPTPALPRTTTLVASDGAFNKNRLLDLYSARVRCADCTCGYSEVQGGYALCNSAEAQLASRREGWDRAVTAMYFGAWYMLSVGYSIFNKQVTNVLPLPWCVATAQIGTGAILCALLWATGVRKRPTFSRGVLQAMLPLGVFHAVGHLFGVVGTTWGSVAFSQVVKCAGPVYACALSSLVLKQSVSLRVWLSLLPILGGVALATTSELAFAWAALIGAVVSDLAFSLRNVYSKLSMNSERGSTLDSLGAADTFALTTCLASALAVPCAIAAEGRTALGVWRAAAPTAGASLALLRSVLLTGLYFYGYSEVAMKALKNVHPVTHAVANTMRRIVILLICIAIFNTPMSLAGAAGSAIAIGGSYYYAMVKSAEKAAAEAAAARVSDHDLVAHKLKDAMPFAVTDPASGRVEADGASTEKTDA